MRAPFRECSETAAIAVTMFCLTLVRGASGVFNMVSHDMSQTSDALFVIVIRIPRG